MTAGWQTEDHPREKLTVADERETSFLLVEILYRVVPLSTEEIAQALEKVTARPLTRWNSRLLHFDPGLAAIWTATPTSMPKQYVRPWLGNNESSSTLTSRTVRRSPRAFRRVEQDECFARALKANDEYMVLLPGARAITAGSPRSDAVPRVLCADRERLRHTYDGKANGYQNLRQFRADVRLVATSLQATRARTQACSMCKDSCGRIDTFGFHLATLDVRQHASVLHDVVSSGLDDPEWLLRSSVDRRRLLVAALEKDMGQCRIGRVGETQSRVFDAIMQGRHRYGPRRWVISSLMARRALTMS